MAKTKTADTTATDTATTTATTDTPKQESKASALEKYKNLYNYGKRDRWNVPKDICKAFPDMDFHFFRNEMSRINTAEGDGWTIVTIPTELAEKVKRVRKSELLFGSISGDTWVVGDLILMMRPKDEVEVLRAMKELSYKKLEGRDINKQRRDIAKAVPEYNDEVAVEIEATKE